MSHLPPPSLSSFVLVSRRFHSLVTTPHAWRIAFSRYFPGPDGESNQVVALRREDTLVSDKRFFARLTALASWRSEYILRTRLLRSLARGKPAAQLEPSKKRGAVRSANLRNGSAVVTYTSQLLYPVSHIAGSFSTETTKRQPLFIHGAAEQGIASASDPSTVKVGTWGLSDHQLFRHFADLYVGEAEYGLGSGNMVGLPNRMDVSQPYGMIYGEGCPQGRAYFISSTELRGRFLGVTKSGPRPHLGIPDLNVITSSVTSVWIAKSSQVLRMTRGSIGMMSGSSAGVLSAYSLGPNPLYEARYERGQITAKWVLCPGVPIVDIAVDDSYSPKRYDCRRIWAVVLNALGEVFYLADLPRLQDINPKATAEELDVMAWKSGRTVRWELTELSRRVAKPDPFSRELVDGSYSPRSSSDSMELDENQIAAETKEIEQYMALKPKHFRKVCEGWDMRRELKVDFAGDDGNGAGESIMVIARGVGEDEKASLRRFTRKVWKMEVQPAIDPMETGRSSPIVMPASSIFGGPVKDPLPSSDDVQSLPPSRASARLGGPKCSTQNTVWFISEFNFGGRKSIGISASALDISTYAVLTQEEDPLMTMSGGSTASSSMSSPLPRMEQPSSNSEIPGQRARYVSVGTDTGLVFVWDIRSPTARNPEVINNISPLRVIQTDSPGVSSVAITSLYLVHGGSDGLVQAWDPLASSTGPIRTINSRFSSRARRQLVQAEASVHGVGNNFFATGAICLDPDPTVLRGMIALGTHLRYWSYSSSAADQYKAGKRRWRRGQRGDNLTGEGQQRFNNSGRGAIQDYIEDEKIDMERQKVADRKEKAHLTKRFGVDLLGPDASEEEVIAYAQLLSQEAYSSDAAKRGEHLVDPSSTISTSPSTLGPNDFSSHSNEPSSSSSPFQGSSSVGDGGDGDGVDDPEIAEAIRLSLLDEKASSSFDTGVFTPFEHAIDSQSKSSQSDYSHSEPPMAEGSRRQEIDDLEFALQLSLVENQSQETEVWEEFPALQPSGPSSSSDGAGGAGSGKGKGKGRGW